MRYMITTTDAEGQWDALPADEQDRILRQHEEFEEALQIADKFVAAYHLYPRDEAMTVRQNDVGMNTETSGPYDDRREYMGGAYIIDADSMDEAVEWARRGRFMAGGNEVRQVFE
jgi:hypothetical protein